jgi:predicted phage tail protein
MRKHAQKFSHYAIICKSGDRTEEFSEQQYLEQQGQYDEIRFVPIVEGAGAVFRIVVGIVIIIAGWGNPAAISVGASLILGGIAEMLAPKPKTSKGGAAAENKDSHYFGGPVNTEEQGIPVPLIYGRCLVGSHIHACGRGGKSACFSRAVRWLPWRAARFASCRAGYGWRATTGSLF